MTNKEAIPILKRLQEPEPWEPHITMDTFDALELAIEALKDREQIFHLECLRCKEPVGTYSRQTMEQVSYTHYSYCEDCLRKGLKMLKKQDALDNQKEPPEDSDSEMNSTKFKPGDKFILELGEERKIFGEFEIAGTDLYVKTDLLEKLTKYEPVKKFEIYNDHTDCIWYHYEDEEPSTCPSTCSQYRDGWNDAMEYTYYDGKGYRPYKRKAK